MWIWCRGDRLGFSVHSPWQTDDVKRAESVPRSWQSFQSQSRKQGNAAGEHRVSGAGEPQNTKKQISRNVANSSWAS